MEGRTHFYYHAVILHRLESSTRPILTPYGGRRWCDLNLPTTACESPTLPLCYRHRQTHLRYIDCVNFGIWICLFYTSVTKAMMFYAHCTCGNGLIASKMTKVCLQTLIANASDWYMSSLVVPLVTTLFTVLLNHVCIFLRHSGASGTSMHKCIIYSC